MFFVGKTRNQIASGNSVLLILPGNSSCVVYEHFFAYDTTLHLVEVCCLCIFDVFVGFGPLVAALVVSVRFARSRVNWRPILNLHV